MPEIEESSVDLVICEAGFYYHENSSCVPHMANNMKISQGLSPEKKCSSR